jgi:hypothetical protein
MRALGHPLCNWQFEKCYLSNWPAMRYQFTNGCVTLCTKGAQFYGEGPTGGMLTALSHLGAYVESITWTTAKMYCRLRPTMERTIFKTVKIEIRLSENGRNKQAVQTDCLLAQHQN